MHTGFWWGNLKEGDTSEDQHMDERMVSEWILKK